MRELVLAFLTWISAETGLTMPPPPLVVLLSSAQLTELAYGPDSPVCEDLWAAYDGSASVVYMRTDWNAAGLRARASLLHELVHHVQFFNKVPARCPAEREQLAYELTLRWLREQGAADPYAVLDIDEFTVFILSHCPE
jgi:Domain of unknown function (DUF6647)